MERHKRKTAAWHVVRGENGWVVKRSAANSGTAVYETQAEAIEAARGLLRKSGGELRTEGRDGRFRDSFTVGREYCRRVILRETLTNSIDEASPLTSAGKRSPESSEAKG